MKRISNLMLGAVSAVAISALPINLDLVASGGFEPAAVYAKGGNGGGNNGGGNGGGKGGENGNGSANGNGNGNGNGNANGGAGTRGKSADAKGHTKASGARQGAGNMFGAIFGKERSHVKGAKTSPVKTNTAKSANRAVKMAALPANAPLPVAKPKNFHAKLAGLNSLNRNYHAYLNSKSPRMAAISAFVMASAEFDLAQEQVAEATAALADAQADFAAAVNAAALTPYDGAVGVYDAPTVESLAERLNDLNNATVAPEDLADWEAEVAAVENLLDSAEATAVAGATTSLDEAELAAETASVGTDDEALKAALLDGANANRVAQYGDDYVDQEMMDWAKDLLGVGEAYGKIDEVRETLEGSGD